VHSNLAAPQMQELLFFIDYISSDKIEALEKELQEKKRKHLKSI
jgi:hypothetical protein